VAESYFNNALTIYTSINGERLARVNLNIASPRRINMKRLSRISMLSTFYKIDHPNGIAESLLELSETYLAMKNYDRQLITPFRRLKLSEKQGQDIELGALQLLRKFILKKVIIKKHIIIRAKHRLTIPFSAGKSIITEMRAKYKTERKKTKSSCSTGTELSVAKCAGRKYCAPQ
jgi:hypothetical protein